jgi:Predicted acetyltransferase
VVSQAVHRRKISIGGVYTPKKYRNRGYSTICTYLLSKKILDEGAGHLVIHTDETSVASDHVYEKIGFVYTFDLINRIFE